MLYSKVRDGMRYGRRILAMIESPFSTKEGYAMREDTVFQLRQPETFFFRGPADEDFTPWRTASSGAGGCNGFNSL